MYSEDGINKKTEDIFKNASYRKLGFEQSLNYKRIYERLNYYTIYRDKRHVPSIIKEYIKNIKHENNINCYDDDNVYFNFLLLSDYSFGKSRKKELKSNKRLHKCHGASYNIIFELPYDNVSLLTGFVNIENHDILHSVVEIISDRDVRIIDYTQNIIMLKEDYINITNFKEISKISKEDIENDKNIAMSLNLKLPYYLFFRDEIMKDIKKNEKVLKLEK